MGWFKEPPAPVSPQSTTDEDRLAELYRDWKAAEVVLADANLALNRFRTTHPQHQPVKPIGDDLWIQLVPDDPELLRLTSAENRARFDRDVKQRAWAILHKELHPDDAHVAGAKV